MGQLFERSDPGKLGRLTLGGQSKPHTRGQLKIAHQSVGTFKIARLVCGDSRLPA
jgi:hypothetical protein